MAGRSSGSRRETADARARSLRRAARDLSRPTCARPRAGSTQPLHARAAGRDRCRGLAARRRLAAGSCHRAAARSSASCWRARGTAAASARASRRCWRAPRPARTLDEADVARCSRRAARDFDARLRGGRRAAPPPARRARHLRRQPQHQLHQRLLLHSCQFCAFSKGKAHENLRGPPYDLRRREIVRRVRRGLGARRDRGLPAGRHPSGLHRRDLPRHLRGR